MNHQPSIIDGTYPIEQFVAVTDKEMKAAWFLVSNTDLKTRERINKTKH